MKKLRLLSILLCLLTAFTFTSNAQSQTFDRCGSTIVLNCDGSFIVIPDPDVMVLTLWTGGKNPVQFNNWNPKFKPVPLCYYGTIPSDCTGNWWLGFNNCQSLNLSNALMDMGCCSISIGTNKGITTDKEALQIHAYPNPAIHSDVTLELPYAEETYTVSVFDLNGRLLVNKQSQGGKTTISTNNLGTGLYILRAESENYQYTEKIQLIK